MNKSSLWIFLVLIYSCSFRNTKGQDINDLSTLFSKDDITIVITDSGLGGLSVVDDLSKKMKRARCFKHVNLIFVNALFDANSGYNSLNTRSEKIKKFDNVLTAIDKNFHPDAVMIACNTLSVIYKETDWSGKTNKPVIGIVEPGVKLIKEKLSRDSNSNVIIFGTETTIEENSHKKALIESNFDENRIITKACPQLQAYIEQNPKGEETGMLIAFYLSEALEQLRNKHGNLYLSLNCSHFGYSMDLWEKALSETTNLHAEILDPNHRMGDLLMPEKYRDRFTQTDISLSVISKVELVNMKSLYSLFETDDPELAAALENYSIIPDLF
jgi:glutamate racemase